MAEERIERRLAAILAADVVGYSRLIGADEGGARTRFNELIDEIARPSLDKHRGRLVKTMGDGFLVEFGSLVDAVQCAADIQTGVAEREGDKFEDDRMLLRIGVHLGDVIVEGEDIHGDGVNIAARLEGLAEPGGICVSGMAHAGVHNKLAFEFDDLGDQSLKNIAAPVRVFRLILENPDKDGPSATGESFRQPAIAVLPFENLSGDPEQEYFGDGLTEDIITALSLWRSFPVIARNSVFAFKGTSPDIRRVGEELGARYVIEGSVRRSGDRVRVTAQLIEAETGHHVWAERYDRPIDDFFDLQDEIADRIAAVIEPALVRAEGKRIAAKRPSDLAAWEYCVRGFDHLAKFTHKDNILAREMFAAALALDPNYARAHSGMAYTHCRDFRFRGTENIEESRRAAFKAARRAIALDETDSQAHVMLSRAYSLGGEGESCIAEGRRALELNPHDTEALVFTGSMLGYWGDPEEGIVLLERGLELNPLDPRNFNFMAHLCVPYLSIGAYEKAAHWGREATRRNPDFFESHAHLASALGYLGRGEEARDLLARFDDSAMDYVRGRTWLRQDVTEILLEGLRKAGLTED